MANRDLFLRELGDRLAAEGVELSLRMALLQESSAHLDASIQARMETGDPASLAETEAVAAFGSAKRYASDMTEALLPDRRARVRPGRVLGSFMCFSLCVGLLSGQLLIQPMLLLSGLFAIGVAACSYRARRPDLIGLAGVGAVFACAVWLGMGTLWIWAGAHGGQGFFPRWDVARARSTFVADIARLEKQASFMDRAAAAFSAPGVDPAKVAASLGLGGDNVILVPRSVGLRAAPNSMYRAESPDVGVAIWRESGAKFAQAARSLADEQSEQLLALDLATADPISQSLPRMGVQASSVAPLFVLGLWLATCAGAAAGQIVRACRLWKRRSARV
jgi:hypothetical protein